MGGMSDVSESDTGPLGHRNTGSLLGGYRRLLIFGGSFDPPHRAHVELPEAVRVALGADVILYLPAGRAPHKLDKQQTAGVHRLAMLRLALADAIAADTAVVLDDEIRRVEEDGRPSYTVDTLEDLATRVAPGAEMRLLIGTDQVEIFESWKDWQRVIELAEPVVMVRPPETVADVPADWRGRVVEVPALDVSSTEVRGRVAAGVSVVEMVGERVAAYLSGHSLYQVDGVLRPSADPAPGWNLSRWALLLAVGGVLIVLLMWCVLSVFESLFAGFDTF